VYQNPTENEISNREYKASAFTTYFGDPKKAADLYRALSHTKDVKPEDIEFKTLQGTLFMVRKNDMAFTVRQKVLVIGEHQSTVNMNMPLRSAIYYGRTMELMIPPRSMYRTGLIKIPTPEFYVFYNGRADQPCEQILRLSDAYLENAKEPMLELIVKVININPSANHPILQESRSLYEYSFFIQSIREHMEQGQTRDEAIIQAMEEYSRQGIMVDFINEHGTEVRNLLFTEFNIEDALEVCKEENFERGMATGIEKGIEKGMATGTDRINTLNQRLKADGRVDDLMRAIDDKNYQEQLLKEYNL